ncbi:hypothetical protein Tco_0532648 [Tanacetum coccineum]
MKLHSLTLIPLRLILGLLQIGIKSLVMSSASSVITYTSVYTDSEPGRVFWGADEEISDGGFPRVIVYGYDGLPMQPVAPPSPDYVPGPEHPPSPVEIPYIPEPEYPEYLVPLEDEPPMEDQPLPANASPAALSPGYVPDSDLEEDPEEDSEEEHADYPADGGDRDDEPSDDDSDDDTDDDEEPFEDEDDDEEEEEHLAPTDSSATPVADPVPSARDTEAFKTDESAPTPRSPQTIVPFAQTRLRRARKTVRLEPPMSASMEACIAEYAAAPTPPLPVASPPLPLPSPLTTSPTDAGAPLGYKAARIRMRAAATSPPLSLPSTSPRTDVPEAEMPPRKRACLTTPAPGYEIEESSAAGATRQPRPTLEVDTWDEIRTEEFQVRFEEAYDDRAYLNTRVNTLFRDRPYHCHTALALDREAVYAHIAWTSSEERSAAIEAHVRTWEAQRLETQSPRMDQLRLAAAVSHVSFVAILYSLLSFMGYSQLIGCVAAALEERDASRSRDGDNSHGSRTDKRRQVPTQRECTYTDFLKCQPMNFKGTEGVVKFASCTLQGSALTWWNSHVRAVGQDVAYTMPWTALKRMITDKYCPRGEIKKLESEYVGGLPDIDSMAVVKASQPQSMQRILKFSTEMLDNKLLTAAGAKQTIRGN